MSGFGQGLHGMCQNDCNGTLCPVRVGGIIFAVLATAVFFTLSVWTVVALRQPLDYGGFGGGLASVWGVVGIAIAAKSFAEKRS